MEHLRTKDGEILPTRSELLILQFFKEEPHRLPILDRFVHGDHTGAISQAEEVKDTKLIQALHVLDEIKPAPAEVTA